MERISIRFSGLLLSLLVAATILFGSTWLAQSVRSSGIYNKSRLMSIILSQEEISFSDMAGSRRNANMMVKFVGALTSAYIDFEMIPVNEFDTFTAVFESMGSEIAIDRFAYQRKNLIIYGQADTQEAYQAFLSDLRETDQFDGVSGHDYLTTADTIRFEIACISHISTLELGF